MGARNRARRNLFATQVIESTPWPFRIDDVSVCQLVPAFYWAGLLCSLPFPANAPCETSRTIKLVVPYTPGSPSDIMARMLMEEISRAQGPKTVVENRSGGSTAIGTEAVARAAPDGGTLLIATTALIINSHLRKLNYHPLTSFEPICNLASSPLVLVVNGTSAYRSLGDLLDSARVKPAP